MFGLTPLSGDRHGYMPPLLKKPILSKIQVRNLTIYLCPWFLRKAIWYVSNCRILRNIHDHLDRKLIIKQLQKYLLKLPTYVLPDL